MPTSTRSSHARLRLRSVAISSRTRAVYCSTSLPTAGPRKTFQPRHIAGSAQIAGARRASSAGESDAVRAAGKGAPPRDVPRIPTKGSALNGISLQERLEHRRPADHVRRRPRSVGVEPEISGRRSQGGSGTRDFEVLVARKRCRALRAHLRADVAAHLGTLRAALARRCGRVRQAARILRVSGARRGCPTRRKPWLVLLHDPRPPTQTARPARRGRLPTSASCRTVGTASC